MTHNIWRQSIDSGVDVDERVCRLLDWHLSSETGSPFWSNAVSSREKRRITGMGRAGLDALPHLERQLAQADARSLMPRALQGEPIYGVFESGGTTGGPKRVVAYEAWTDIFTENAVQTMVEYAFPRDATWLAAVPSGPHIVGELVRAGARAMGGVVFSVDIDPRWAKTGAARREKYIDHVCKQIVDVLHTQSIEVLVTTPALLLQLVGMPGVLDRLRQLKGIRWGGTHFPAPERFYVMNELLPDIPLYGSYGNTLTLGYAAERPGNDANTGATFDAFSPFTSFKVVEGESETCAEAQSVDVGTRGRVMTRHISPGWLLPHVLERDTAERATRSADNGDSLRNIEPLKQVGETAIVEGVY